MLSFLVLSKFLLLMCRMLPLVETSSDDPTDTDCDRSMDIAIVGAGPAGTYFAYKIRNAGLQVGLFEYSDRIGGRLYTRSLPNTPDVQLELGGMHYVGMGLHPKLALVVRELKLTPGKFKDGFGRPNHLRHFLRGVSLRPEDIKNGDVPYNLSSAEKDSQGNIFHYYLSQLTGNNESFLPEDTLLSMKVKDGRELYTLTFDRPVITLQKGMQSLPEAMMKAFLLVDGGHSVTRNRKLQSIIKSNAGLYYLTFFKTVTDDGFTDVKERIETVCAKKVVLAIPQFALKKLKWAPLRVKRIWAALHAARPALTSKIFMTFPSPWWLLSANTSAYVIKSDTPFQQMYDWQSSVATGESILMASYADSNNSVYLESLNSDEDLMIGSALGANKISVRLKEEVLSNLADAFGINRKEIPEPTAGISQFWSGYPFGGGWLIWKAGHNIKLVNMMLQRPSENDDVFVVGADFSCRQMVPSTEDALTTVDDVFRKYFN